MAFSVQIPAPFWVLFVQCIFFFILYFRPVCAIESAVRLLEMAQVTSCVFVLPVCVLTGTLSHLTFSVITDKGALIPAIHYLFSVRLTSFLFPFFCIALL